MPASDSPPVLVARFLKANGYEETLVAFLVESDLPAETAVTSPGDLTIEQVLEEKKLFDLSAGFEKVEITDDDVGRGWLELAPSTPTKVSTLPTSANLLYISNINLKTRTTVDFAPEQVILVTSASRHISLISPTFPTFPPLPQSLNQDHHDSPVLSCHLIRNRYLLSTTMSGQLHLTDLPTGKTLDIRRDHSKFCIKVAVWDPLEHSPTDSSDPQADTDCQSRIWIATAGWDSKIFFYHLSFFSPPSLPPPTATLTLPTNPLSILFLPPNSPTCPPTLLVSRTDSTLLEYHSPPHLLGTQSLTPLSASHNAFSPSCLALCPTDPALLAVATSHVPHLKFILVKLLHPPSPPSNRTTSRSTPTSSTEDAEKAILLHTTTLAPQTPYSTPLVVWRPGGKGVWVNGEDGCIRGVDTRTGKLMSVLKGGHSEGECKVRCLWSGMVRPVGGEGREEEWVVSGGFDRRLVVWRVGKAEAEGGGS